MNTTIDADPIIEKKVDGRSRAARAARAAASPPTTDRAAQLAQANAAVAQRAAARNPVRTPTRGKAEVRGRNGEVLSRKRTTTNDIFHIPQELIEPGWELQWIAMSVVGNTEIVMDQNLQMLENGWRPVPSDRFPGRFMPQGHSGHIIRGGQGLYERPKALCDEARAEDHRNARQLMSDRNDALKLSGVKKNLADGFEMGGKYRGTGGDIRMKVDRALYYDDSGEAKTVSSPHHDLADPGE